MKRLTCLVDEASNGIRLDKFLSEAAEISRGEAKRTLARGGVWLCGKRVKSESRTVSVGQRLEVYLLNAEELSHRERLAKSFDAERILFKDDSILIVNKPPFLPSQATPDSDAFDVVSLSSKLADAQVFPLHRLDKETSGVTLVALTKSAATTLSQAFQERRVHKTYLALVAPNPSAKDALGWIHPASSLADTFDVDLAIVSDRSKPGRMKAVRNEPSREQEKGLPKGPQKALTHVRVLNRFPSGALLIEAHPETGRMHQIRVHMASLGFPLLGDTMYGGMSMLGSKLFDRVMLHATSLRFFHPKTAKTLLVEAPLSEDFSEFLQGLEPSVLAGNLPRHLVR